MAQRLLVSLLGLSVLFAASPGPASAATPSQKCASSKTKEAGKKADGKLKCWSKEVTKPGGLSACETKVESKFASKYAKAEAKGGCAVTGDANAIEAKVDAFVDDVVTELTGSPAGALLGSTDAKKCAAAKLKAAGKKAASKLKCHAKAKIKSVIVDMACLQKAEAKYSKKWDNAEAKGGCATINDKVTIEAKVDAFVLDVSIEIPSTTTVTTSTTTLATTTSTTTTLPTSCCAAEEIHTLSTGHCDTTTSVICTSDGDCPGSESCVSDGFLQVATLPAFPFPLGVSTYLDVAAAGSFPTCKHDVIIPPGGFLVPVFCIPALGFTSQVSYTGCESGSGDGKGRLWDGAAACADADVAKVGDTSDGVCNPPGQPCITAPGGAGNNSLGDIDTTRGNTVCDGAGVQLQIDLPANSLTWLDADGDCPDLDGAYDAGTDSLITQFDFILSPTTAAATAAYVEKNGDACTRAGAGPNANKVCSNDNQKPCGGDSDCPIGGTCVVGPLHGSPALGPCCVVGQTNKIAAAGIAFTGGAPLFDILFQSSIPNRVVSCGPWPGPGSCTLTTDPCLGSPSGAFVDEDGGL